MKRLATAFGVLVGLVTVTVIVSYATSAVTIVGALTSALIGGAG